MSQFSLELGCIAYGNALQKVIVGLSIAGVFVAIGTIVATMWLIRRRRRAAREVSLAVLMYTMEE